MYGWRGRLGLLVPYDNTVIEPEFARTMPIGVSAHVLRLTQTDRKEQPQQALQLAPAMAHLRANAALFCNASAFINGRAEHDSFLEQLRLKTGIPTESAASAMIGLMAQRNVKRVFLFTLYRDWMLKLLCEFVSAYGFEIAGTIGSDKLNPADINELGPEQVYRMVRGAQLGTADAVFIVATNLRTLEILETLERDLGRVVMSSNQALMWIGKKALGLCEEDISYAQPRFAWPTGQADE